MNYFPWSIDLRIPFPPSHPLKKVYLLEAPHLQVADMGTKYSGQLSVEQRKNTHVQTKCGYAQTGYVKPCLLALKNTLQLLCSFSLFTNATDQAHNMIYFFFSFLMLQVLVIWGRASPFTQGPGDHILCGFGASAQHWEVLPAVWGCCWKPCSCEQLIMLQDRSEEIKLTIPEVVGNSGTELPIKTQLFTAEKCALSWDTWGWTVSPD